MKFYFLYLLSVVYFFIPSELISQNSVKPVAKFSFDNRKDYDEVGLRKIKLVGVSFTRDRFNNEDCAAYLLGNQSSYINLGNYPEIKPVQGSISLWVKVEFEIHAGSGHRINPVIITKSYNGDDFYEAYAIYYLLDSRKIACVNTEDSLRQIGIPSSEVFSRNRWHHLVITYDDHWLCFYIDGKPEGKVVKGYTSKFLETDSVIIGVSANKKNSRYFNGSIDEIEFYDRVITPEEVLELYHAPNPNKNKIFLYWAVAFLAFLLLVFMIYLLIKLQLSRTLRKEKTRLELHNKLLETELRVNRALMNPHFIFNSLNALQNYILKSQMEGAVDYLAKFSKLIRKILEGNMSDTISLALEIELIEGYMEIENLRFKEKIDCSITLGHEVHPLSIKIPVMMLQPFIENAIWHAFQGKEGEKKITIRFLMNDPKYLECIIEDNGMGRKAKQESHDDKRSLATMFVVQRLEMLNKIYNLQCSLTITDKPAGQGTIVKIILPVLNNEVLCRYVQL